MQRSWHFWNGKAWRPVPHLAFSLIKAYSPISPCGPPRPSIMRLFHVSAHGRQIEKDRKLRPGLRGSVGGGIYFAETAAAAKRKALSGFELAVDMAAHALATKE
jgi:hypothetical protein